MPLVEVIDLRKAYGNNLAVIVLTKPVSRSAFVLAKALSQGLFLTAFTAAAALACWVLTLAVFGEAPARPLANATLL